MRTALRYCLYGSISALFLLQSGCGLIESGLHVPNSEKEDWNEWKECPKISSSLTGIEHPVYCLEEDSKSNGAISKPPVLLLHELNGLTPQTFRYATELSKDFTVYIPMLFGNKGEESIWRGSWAYWIGPWVFWTKQEWKIPSDSSAPIVKWLRDVVSNIERTHKSMRIRIIGNCMTGALPLALLSKADGTVNAKVDAVVLAQPALPVKFWWLRMKKDSDSLDISNKDLEVAQSSQAKILALRFERDWISPPEKQDTLREFFGNLKGRLVAVEICEKDYDPEGKKMRAHSTLIGEYDADKELGKQSRNIRETVRNFLLDPTNTVVEHSICSSRQ